MKPKQTLTRIGLPVLMVIGGLIQSNQSAASDPVGDEDKKPKKEKALRLNSSIKVFPDVIRKAMHIRSTSEKEVSFFVFDLEGKMVLSYKLQKGERKTIEGLPKGTYVYQAFCEDTQAGSGKLQFR